MNTKSSNIVWSESLVSKKDREKLIKNKGCVIWLTGLSGSGKSTIAKALEQELLLSGKQAYILDGDNIRHGLCGDLAFSPEDREENIRRISHVAALFADAGVIAISAFISPFKAGRKKAANYVEKGRFFEVFVDTPLAVCEDRDPKGLYQKVRSGEIKNFTGINSIYEIPENPDLIINTNCISLEKEVELIINMLRNNKIIG